MTTLLRISPLDVLYLRGNRLFSGSVTSEVVMPPWPSLFAGALRARMLVDDPAAEREFQRGALGGRLGEVVGAGAGAPGTFRLAFMALARGDELLVPAPADVTVPREGARQDTARERAETSGAADVTVLKPEDGARRVLRAVPRDLRALGVEGSFALSDAAVLRVERQEKAMSGAWLTERGLAAWQRGEVPAPEDVVRAAELWSLDKRLGIALDDARGTAQDGMLYTSDTVALAPGVGFVVGVRGADGALPAGGLLRLGGDGRGATVAPFGVEGGERPWERLPAGDRFTMTLATPMISSGGWLPPGASAGPDGEWAVGGLRLRVRAAVVGRAGVISGWDLDKHRPKAARRAAPAGSVYFLERVSGSLDELARVRDQGLGALEPEGARDRMREAEGFGSVWFGEWPAER